MGRPPPACLHQIAERQGPKPSHRIHEGMQHYQQGNNGDIKDSNPAVKGFQAMTDSEGQDGNSNTAVAADEGLLSKDDLV